MNLQPLLAQSNPSSSPLLINQYANPATIQNIVNEKACLAARAPVDVVFSIDSSYSMEKNDPANLRLNASKAFIDELDPTKDRAAAVSWGGKLGFKSELESNFDELKQNIERINLSDANLEFSQQNTDYNIGIKEAINILDNNTKNSTKIVIFLSDGEHNAFEDPPIPYEPNSVIDYATEKKYKIYAIGLNISSDSDGEKLLRAMSEPTGGKYFPSPSPENLKEIFNSIFVQEVQHFEFQPTNIDVAVKGFGGTSERRSPVNVVFSIDGSGSMDQNDPDDLRLNAAKVFMDKLNPQKDAAGIVSWSGQLDLAAGLTSDFNSLKGKADTIERRAGTNLNVGISSAIQMLDKGFTNDLMNPSKSIVFLTDGKGEYTKSGMPGSPADQAKFKGYKIFPIGLNVEGTEGEIDLKDIGAATGGQYFSAPTAENLQAIYEDIFERVIESTAPANLTLVETFPDYVQIDQATFTVPPTSVSKDGIGQTIIKWQNISKTVGDKENRLSTGEEFLVGFKAGFNDNIIKHLVRNASNVTGSNHSDFSLKAPLINEQQSVVQYLSPNGFNTEEKVRPAYVNLQIKTCENQKIAGLAQEFTQSPIFKRYASPSFPFSIDYPNDWEIEQSLDRVSIDSPQDHPYDKYREGVDVYVFDTNYPTLKELVDAIIQDDKVDITGYNLTDVRSATLGGLPSKVLIYTYSDSVWGPTKTMESISLAGGKYFIVSYSAKPLQFDVKLPIVDHMINSMTINR
jgi:Mg-chelatase subunit ChlD